MSPPRESNGHSVARPAPLRIHRVSHMIHKPSPAPSSSSSAVSGEGTGGQKQQQQPVIIYAYSPKIIHTPARDFMALVQKLTGMSHAEALGGGAVAPRREARTSGYAPPRNDNSSSCSPSLEKPAGSVFAPIPIHYYRCPEASGSISPSTMELLKAFNDY